MFSFSTNSQKKQLAVFENNGEEAEKIAKSTKETAVKGGGQQLLPPKILQNVKKLPCIKCVRVKKIFSLHQQLRKKISIKNVQWKKMKKSTKMNF